MAHQGGWDEALFVAIPLVLFGLLLVVARRRAEREAADADQPSTIEPPEPAGPGT